MSDVIDSRVVELQFDNKEFEESTKQSMSTLEKLKNVLKFDKVADSAKGLAASLGTVNQAVGKVDANPIAQTFNRSLSLAESYMQLFNYKVANFVQNTQQKMVGMIITDPIRDGFKEYETQLDSVQTILANTSEKGTTLGEVNAALKELNDYADKTIYNFTQMTQNIGRFTAAGLDLDVSTKAIQGISNLAAVSGSTSQQASTAMYQLSQALSTGALKLQDWNSVVNAGMGGQVFQEALKRTAKAHGVAVDEIIEKEGSFRESLSKGWITTDILSETLNQFAGAYDDAQLSQMGYTDDQIKSIQSLAKTAEDAATKVKTFTQLIDTTKEALGSGWTTTWQYIFGDFEQAKELWTSISDYTNNIINSASDKRNNFLGELMPSNWDRTSDAIQKAGYSMDDFKSRLAGVYKETTQGVGDLDVIIEQYGTLGEAIRKGAISSTTIRKTIESMNNDLGGGNPISDLAKGAGFDKANDQVKAIQQGLKDVGADISEYGIDGKWGDETQKAIEKFQEDNGLEITGKIDDKTFEALNKQLEEMGKTTLDTFGNKKLISLEWVDEITKLGGRDLAIYSLQNAFNGILSVLTPIKSAFDETFKGPTVSAVLDFLTNLEAITAKMKLSAVQSEFLKSTFTTLFGVMKSGLKTVGSFIKSGFSKVGALFTEIGKNAKASWPAIRDFGKAFSDWFVGEGHFDSMVEKAGGAWNKLSEGVKNVSDWVKNTSTYKEASKWITDFFSTFKDESGNIVVPTWMKAIPGYMSAIGEKAKEAWGYVTALWDSFLQLPVVQKYTKLFGDAFTHIFDGIGGVLSDFPTEFSKFIESFKNLEAPSLDEIWKLISNSFTGTVSKVGDLFTPLKEAIEQALSDFGDWLTGIFIKVGEGGSFIGKFMSKAFEWVTSWSTIGKGLAVIAGIKAFKGTKAITGFIRVLNDVSGLLESGKSLAQTAESAIKGDTFKKRMDSIALTIGAIAVLGGVLILMSKCDQNALQESVKTLTIMVAAIIVLEYITKKADLGSGDSFKQFARSALELAGAVLIIAIATKAIMVLQKQDGFIQAAVTVGLILLAMAGLMALMNVINSKAGADSQSMNAGTILAFAASVYIVVKALGKVAKMVDEYGGVKMAISLGIIVGIMAVLALVAVAASKIPAKGFGVIFGLSIAIATLVGALVVLSMIKPENLLNAVLALGTVMVLLSLMMAASSLAKGAGGAILSIALLMGTIAAVFHVMGKMDQGQIATVTAALAAIIAMLAIFEGVSALASGAVIGIMGIVAFLLILVVVYGMMSQLPAEQMTAITETLTKVIGAFSKLMLVITANSVLTGGVGSFASVIGTFLGFTVVIAALAILATACEKIPALKGAIMKGADFLGEVLGHIIKSIGDVVGQSLIDGLSKVADGITALGTAFDSFSGAVSGEGSEQTLSALDTFADVILKLTGAELLDAISKFVTGDDDQFAKFAKGIGKLGKGLRKFSDNLGEGFDAATVEAAAKPIESLVNIANKLPSSGGWIQKFAGFKDLGGFSKGVKELGTAMAEFGDAIAGSNFNTTAGTYDGVVELINAMVAVANALPDSYKDSLGNIQNFKDFNGFAEGCKSIGAAVSAFVESISPYETGAGSYSGIAEILSSMAEVGAAIPPTKIDELKHITEFPNYKAFATGMSNLMGSIGAFVTETAGYETGAGTYSGVVEIMGAMAEIEAAVGTTKVDDLHGIKEFPAYKEFAKGMRNLMSTIRLFVTKTQGFDMTSDNYSGVISIMENMTALSESIPESSTKLFNRLQNFKQYDKMAKGMGNLLTAVGEFATQIPPENAAGDYSGVISLIEAMKGVDEALPKSDTDLFGRIDNFKDLTGFAEGVKNLGEALKQFQISITGVNFTDTDSATAGVGALIDMVDKASSFEGWATGATMLKNNLETIGEAVSAFYSIISSDSVDGKVISNIGTGIGSLVEAARGLAIASASGQDLGSALSSFVNDGGVAEALSAFEGVDASVAETFSGIASAFTENQSAIADAVSQMVLSLQKLKSQFDDTFNNMATVAMTQVSGLNVALNQTDEKLGAGSVDISGVTSAATEAVSSASAVLSGAGSQFSKAAGDDMNAYIQGMSAYTASVNATAKALGTGAANELTSTAPSAYSAGTYFGQGFANGMGSYSGIIRIKAQELGRVAVRALKEAINSNSPSKETTKLGDYFGWGFFNGINNWGSKVEAAGGGLGESALASIKMAGQRISDVLNGTLVMDPTIRPVVDLSSVQSGVTAIDNALSGSSTINALSNIGYVDRVMSNRSITATNDDVVDAIGALRRDIGGLQTNQYNIGGISYDDGSNISTAINDLIHAVSVERRI